MHELYELKEKLLKELEGYGTQELSAGTLQVVDTLAHTVKNICKIIESADEEEYSMRGGGYSRNYSREYSRNRGGNRYAYERGGNRGGSSRNGSMDRYSRDGGYSRADGMEDLVETVRSMMQELPQNVQQDAQRFVQKLEQQM